MEQLELLKKSWDKTTKSDKHFSIKEIYPMLHKKSSSIVRTLFYLSLGELVFWILINFLPVFFSSEYNDKIDTIYGEHTIFTIITILHISIIIIFSYLLFKSYKAISVKDNVKRFMASILSTRKVIKYYVLSNLVLAFVSFVVTSYYAITGSPELTAKIDANNTEMVTVILKFSVIIGFGIGLFWLFYRLVYGILIGRLNKNYNELKKIEG